MSRDLTKQPLWVQDHVKTLENRIAELEALVADDETTPIDYRLSSQTRRHLPAGAIVTFRLSQDLSVDVYIENYVDEPVLKIMAMDALAVWPRADNVVFIRERS
jgi:hypothetical protein